MKIMIDIPEEDIPKVQGTMEINLSFCNGKLCQCDYPFDTDIEQMPSISTEKTGRWEKTHDEYSYWYKCSRCGEKIPKNAFGSDYFSPYCPECGCKMMEVEE